MLILQPVSRIGDVVDGPAPAPKKSAYVSAREKRDGMWDSASFLCINLSVIKFVLLHQ